MSKMDLHSDEYLRTILGQILSGITSAGAFAAFMTTFSGLLVENFDINMLVGWAFAIGASTYFPLLLGSW